MTKSALRQLITEIEDPNSRRNFEFLANVIDRDLPLADHTHVEADITDLDRIKASLIDASGDLIYGSADDTPARLALGTGRNLFLTWFGGAPKWDDLSIILDMGILWSTDYGDDLPAMIAAAGIGYTLMLDANKTYSAAADGLVNFSKPLTVIGQGPNTIIDGGTTGHAVKVSAPNVRLYNFAVQTTPGGGNSYHGVHVELADYCRIRDLTVIDSDYYGIYSAGSKHTVIDSCAFLDSDQTAIITANGTTYFVAANNRILSVGGANAIIQNGDYGAYIGNLVVGGSTRAMHLTTNSSEVVVTGNHFAGAVLNQGNNNVVGNNS